MRTFNGRIKMNNYMHIRICRHVCNDDDDDEISPIFFPYVSIRIKMTWIAVDYIFSRGVSWSGVSVASAVDRGFGTATDSIHLPVSIVIIHDLKESMATPKKTQIQLLQGL